VTSYPCPALLPVGDGGDYVYIFELYAVVLSYHGFFVCSDVSIKTLHMASYGTSLYYNEIDYE
jgi:hypothetical protein